MSESTQVEIGTHEDAEPDEPGAAVAHADEVSSVDALMMRAMERGEDAVDALERLIALRERVEDRNAEMAMAEAMAAFQAECPSVNRTASGHHGNKFSPLDEIARTIRPILARHGLSYTHDGEMTEDGRVSVTCTLRHIEGATRTATFTGPIDESGGKNPIQMVASARSYGRRYTLIDVLGLTAGEDDDGQGTSPAKTISEKEAADIDALIDEVGADRAKFLEWLGVGSVADIPKARHNEVVKALERKRRQS